MSAYASHLKKIISDQKTGLMILTGFCFVFEYLFAWLFFESGISEAVASFIMRLPPAFTAFLGLQNDTVGFATQMLAFGYTHPVILISLAFLQLSVPARYIAGEIELKTFDILLTKPIKRHVILMSILTYLVIALVLQTTAMLLGTVAGNLYFDLQIRVAEYAKAVLVGFFFFLSMGLTAVAISAFQKEKGAALSKAVGLVVFLYFFDTVIRLSSSLTYLLPYSYFQLYQPGKLVFGQSGAGGCILVSFLIGLVSFTVGIFQFNRRDL